MGNIIDYFFVTVAILINGMMIWIAFSGAVLWYGITTTVDAYNHRGPGYVNVVDKNVPQPSSNNPYYGESPDMISVPASEKEYKREEYTKGITGTILGLFFWVLTSKHLMERDAKFEEYEAIAKRLGQVTSPI